MRTMRRWPALLGALLCLLGMGLLPRAALAHDVPPGIVMLDIGRDAIEAELQLPLSELGTALGLPPSSDVATVIAQQGPRIRQMVREQFQLQDSAGHAYAMRIESLRAKKTDNVNWTSNDWLVLQLHLQAPPGSPTEVFALDYRLILQRIPSHQALIYVRRDLRNGLLGEQPMLIGNLGFGNTRLPVDGSGGSWWQGLRQLFVLGMEHIAEGPDHLLFLLALLLPAPLRAAGGRWQAGQGLRRSIATIVRVVSGFTVGHSISLALAATGLVVAPTRAVEILIAVSILVSCLHAWRPLFAGRELWIASAFGLVHGLAFAETLAGLDFDATTLGLSLLGFNVGIEVMQLLVVAAVLPPLLWLSRGRAYAGVRLAGAGFAAACALGWIIERAFGRSNPLQAVSDWLSPPPPGFAWALGLLSCISLYGLLRRR